jgi:hypothetical protein
MHEMFAANFFSCNSKRIIKNCYQEAENTDEIKVIDKE